MKAPARPIPTRVMVFVDGENLYHRCRDHFDHPWIHPRGLAEALVEQDRAQSGGSHVLAGVRYYTGIHDPNRNPRGHSLVERRLEAYERADAVAIRIPLRYDARGRAREKGVDVRVALDLLRLAFKGFVCFQSCMCGVLFQTRAFRELGSRVRLSRAISRPLGARTSVSRQVHRTGRPPRLYTRKRHDHLDQ